MRVIFPLLFFLLLFLDVGRRTKKLNFKRYKNKQKNRAFLALFEPRWLRMIVGGAGWAPVSTFVIQYVYSLIPVTAAAALEESGILPGFFRITPTATIAWALKEGISSPRGLWAAVKAAANGVGIKI